MFDLISSWSAFVWLDIWLVGFCLTQYSLFSWSAFAWLHIRLVGFCLTQYLVGQLLFDLISGYSIACFRHYQIYFSAKERKFPCNKNVFAYPMFNSLSIYITNMDHVFKGIFCQLSLTQSVIANIHQPVKVNDRFSQVIFYCNWNLCTRTFFCRPL